MNRGPEIKGTVPSLRLDALVGVGFKCSRSKAAQQIKEGRVSLEERVVTNPAQQVEPGNKMKWKNHGIARLEEVQGETKKGRLRVVLSRMKEREDCR